MKTVTTATSDKLKQSYDINTSLRLIAEWNMNRYSPITKVSNTVDDSDPDLYPISSIVLPDRPSKPGVVKARSTTASHALFGADGRTLKGYTTRPNTVRYVTASPDAKYKYWSSPAESAGTGVTSTPSSISNTQPTVIYTSPTWSNKIYVMLENSYASPTAWTIDVTTDGTTWTTIATNPGVVSGKVELYRQANGTWSNTIYRDNPVQLRGVRLTVTQMNRSKVYFNLIELGLRLESDLTPFLVDWSADNSMSDHSFITPLGIASSNTANVSLSNVDSRFSNDNPASLYYKLIDKNVDMRLDLGITTDPYTTLNKTYEWIRMFTMSVDDWTGTDGDSSSVVLKDDSLVLQQIKPNPTLLQSKTVAEIIWTLLDSIGMTNYFVETIDADPSTMIPYFWTDGTKTMWEIIQQLSQATQTAVYFDEYNVLQIKTRNVAYNLSRGSTWTFDGIVAGTKLPDIVDLTKTFDYEANIVNIAYKDVKPADEISGIAPMVSMWEPTGDVVLRATPLMHPINATQTWLRMDPSVAPVWPYVGVVQMEGEFIRYGAKEYAYYKADGTLAKKHIVSNDEKIALDALNPAMSFRNAFTGYVWITERGAYNSVGKAHTIDVSGYITRFKTGTGTTATWAGGWRSTPGTSIGKITTNAKSFKSNTWYTISRGSENDSPMTYYGTRVRFPTSGYTEGIAGLAMSLGSSNEAGYYVELYRTSLFSKYPNARTQTNEVSFYVKYADGSFKRFGTNAGKGSAVNIAPGVWYDIDVTVTYGSGGSPTFFVYVNGQQQVVATVPPVNMPPTGNTGRWGIFTRGYTNAEFEYIYGTDSQENPPFDGEPLYSRIHSGYESTQLNREWIYNVRNVSRMVSGKRANVVQHYNQLFYDDFGPTMHEVREFNVKYDVSGANGPSLFSRLYFSNDSQVICPEFIADPFGARFILGNMSRDNAVVNGTDSVTFGADNSVEQKFLAYGRPIIVGDEKIETVKKDSAIIRRGEASVDFPSDWIQSKAEAVSLGAWITNQWAGGQDEVVIKSFMNPLIQLSDLVSVNFPYGNMTTTTHKYFVVGIRHSYNDGVESEFTLRRARI